MAAQLLVLYPTPKDPKDFDRRYSREHLPYAGPRLKGATKVVTKRAVALPGAPPAIYLISEVHFPSLSDLQACALSAGADEAMKHAASISSGGPPQFVVVDEVDA